MAITHLGAKRVQGTKVDRKVDSLGSSADGTNSGITLVNGKEITWTSSGSTTTYNSVTKSASSAGWTNNYAHSQSYSSGIVIVEFDPNVGQGYGSLCGFDDGTNNSTPTDITLGMAGLTSASNCNTIVSGTSTDHGSNSWASGDIMKVEYNIGTGAYSFYRNGGTAFRTGTISSPPSSVRILVSSYSQNYKVTEIKLSGSGTSATANLQKLGTGCYSFDGSNDYVSTTETGLDFQASDSFTVAFWFKTTDTGEAGFISRWNTSNNGWLVLKDTGTTASFRMSSNWGGGNAIRAVATNNAFSDGNWHHLAVTYGGSGHSSIKMYVDGTAQTLNVNLTGTVGTITYGTNLAFGVKEATGSFSDKYDGDLDDIGIWKRELTATEISDLANNVADTPTVTEDFSSDGWTHESTSISGGAFNFDCDQGSVNGSYHSYKALGTTLSNTSWIMRCKLNLANVSASASPDGTGLWLMLCDTTNTNSNVDSLGFSCVLGHQSGFAPYFRLNGGNSTHPRTNLHGGSSGLSHTVTATTYYVELKRNSGTSVTLNLFSDSGFSTLVATSTLTNFSSSSTGYDNIQTLIFDGNNNGTQELDGTIDDIKIWDDATSISSPVGALVSSLSDKSELKANYTMDSTSLGATGTTTTTTSGATQQGSQSGSNQTTAFVTSGSNTGLKFTSTHNGSGSAVGVFDLGSALASKWIAQVSFTTGSSYTSGGNGMFAFGISDKSTYSSSETINTNSSGDTIYWRWHMGASHDRLQNVRTILNGTGSTGSNGTSRAWEDDTTLYFEMSYDGSTVTVQRKTDNTYATNHSQSAVTKSTSGITGLRYFIWGSPDDGGGQGGFNVTLNTLKIYDDVSSLDGCKNDFSSTSALDGQTNLPVNTIFEQTDDTPSYWWKQSDNTWKIDGTTGVPKGIDGLYAWFDANDSSTITKDSSNKVSKWTDKSGNSLGSNLDLLQSSSSLQPTWTSGDKNGLTTLNFSGSYMKTDTSVSIPSESQPITYFFVVKAGSSGERILFDGSYGSNASYDDWRQNIGKNGSNNWFVDGGQTSTGASNTTWYYATAIFNGSSGQLNLNGTTISSTLTTGARQLRFGTMGAWSDGTSSQKWEGTIAEFIVYNRSLTSAEILEVEAYLKDKWGL